MQKIIDLPTSNTFRLSHEQLTQTLILRALVEND